MNRKKYKFIFDLDGTLYAFDKGKSAKFTDSNFYNDLQKEIHSFFVKRKDMKKNEAVKEFKRIKEKYNGEISIGVGKEYGIDRFEYFAQTWGNLNHTSYVEKDEKISSLFTPFIGRAALLTQAPKIWADKIVQYLQLDSIFQDLIFTGETDIRKPDSSAFQHVANALVCDSEYIFSIGDQEHTDILPAKKIGMRTIRIGPGVTVADYQVENITKAIELLRKEGFL